MIEAMLAVSLMFVVPLHACAARVQENARLHWSMPARVPAPNRRWQIEVTPKLDDSENRTPVSLTLCDGSASWPLFTLQRSARVHWSADGEQLLVINEPLSGTRQLLFFSIRGARTGAHVVPTSALEKVVTDTIAHRIGVRKSVEFYLPKLLSWRGRELFLTVGGQSSAAPSGPFESYCFGVALDSETFQVKNVISEKVLRARWRRSCDISP